MIVGRRKVIVARDPNTYVRVPFPVDLPYEQLMELNVYLMQYVREQLNLAARVDKEYKMLCRLRKDLKYAASRFQTVRIFKNDCEKLRTQYRGEYLEHTPYGEYLEKELTKSL